MSNPDAEKSVMEGLSETQKFNLAVNTCKFALEALREAKNLAPNEWDALVGSSAGVKLVKAYDQLKLVTK